MKTTDVFTDEFFKQFKIREELSSFLKELQKRGIEKMLDGELDANLDYKNTITKKKKTAVTVILPRPLKLEFS